jgi:hypothetical protein
MWESKVLFISAARECDEIEMIQRGAYFDPTICD